MGFTSKVDVFIPVFILSHLTVGHQTDTNIFSGRLPVLLKKPQCLRHISTEPTLKIVFLLLSQDSFLFFFPLTVKTCGFLCFCLHSTVYIMCFTK